MVAIALLPSLPLLALVSGAVPLTVEDARAELHDSQLEVTVTTSGPVKPDQVRTKIQKRALIVYVDGAPVPPGRSLGTEKRPITSHPRPAYAKLEIPFGAGVNCGGRIDVQGGPDGVRASIKCERAGTAAPVAAKAEAPRVEAAAPAVVAKVEPTVAAPPPAPPPAPVVQPAPASAPAIATPPEAAAAAPRAVASGSGGPSLVFPGVLLLAAAAGVIFWKKRKITLGNKRIRIIETAALGPKRALILAEVNGATMVIGTSEAGISLLSRAPEGAAAFATVGLTSSAASPARATTPGLGIPEQDDDDDEPSLSANEQGGALARLFGRKPAPPAASSAPTFAEHPEDDNDDPFAAVLRDSLEDQELRARLSNGFNGKVT